MSQAEGLSLGCILIRTAKVEAFSILGCVVRGFSRREPEIRAKAEKETEE